QSGSNGFRLFNYTPAEQSSPNKNRCNRTYQDSKQHESAIDGPPRRLPYDLKIFRRTQNQLEREHAAHNVVFAHANTGNPYETPVPQCPFQAFIIKVKTSRKRCMPAFNDEEPLVRKDGMAYKASIEFHQLRFVFARHD